MIPVPEPVRDALAAHFRIHPDELIPLGGGREDSDGITYSCAAPLGPIVLKILAIPASDHDGLARIEERLRFVHFLSRRGVEIVSPLPAPGGGLLAVHPTPEHLFVAYIMAKCTGRHPDPQEWGMPLFHAWGKAIGKLHCATQEYTTWRGSELRGASGYPLLGWEQEWQSFYDECEDPEVKNCWLSIRSRLEKLPFSSDCFGFIHNDPHNQNILIDEDKLILLDFDVANYHWFVMDIAIALQGLMFSTAGGLERPISDPHAIQAFLEAFLKGYESENHLDPFWKSQIGLFVSYRRALLFTVMQGWLQTVPEIRASWKDMILKEPPLLA